MPKRRGISVRVTWCSSSIGGAIGDEVAAVEGREPERKGKEIRDRRLSSRITGSAGREASVFAILRNKSSLLFVSSLLDAFGSSSGLSSPKPRIVGSASSLMLLPSALVGGVMSDSCGVVTLWVSRVSGDEASISMVCRICSVDVSSRGTRSGCICFGVSDSSWSCGVTRSRVVEFWLTLQTRS